MMSTIFEKIGNVLLNTEYVKYIICTDIFTDHCSTTNSNRHFVQNQVLLASQSLYVPDSPLIQKLDEGFFVANVNDCDILVNEFDLQLSYL